MARWLTDPFVKTAKPGRHYDTSRTGLCLYVRKSPKGFISRRWYQTLSIAGKRNLIGIGDPMMMTAEEAREVAFKNLELAKTGYDPRNKVHALHHRTFIEKDTTPTFRGMAEKVIALKRSGWKDPETMAKKWLSTLERYAFPILGDKPLDQISRRDVRDCLEPHWTEINVTMKIVRQRISEIFKIAIADELVTDNVASEELLKSLPSVNGNTEHLLALPHEKVKEAVAAIRKNKRYIGTRLCLEFVILTACRHHQARELEWQDIDLQKRIWTVSAGKMKMKEQHTVPLSDQALVVLEKAKKLGFGTRTKGLVFPSSTGKQIQPAVLSYPLKDEGIESTIHGFRSSFSSWANENNFNQDAIESCLAHTTPGVRGAYMRGDFLEQRKNIMQEWGAYIS